MNSWKPLGLIAAGRMSDSLLLRRPALSRYLGPVVAPDRRLASRYANSLRAGSPAPVEDLHACGLVLIQAAADGLDRLLPLLHGAGPWRGSRFALLSPDLDASALACLRGLGARVCSVAPAPSAGRDLAVAEGDRQAVQLARQWLADGKVRCLGLKPGRKALFLLGLTTSRGLLAPLLDAALMSLRASGLSAGEARRMLHDAAGASIRAFAARGRKAMEDPARAGRALLVELGLEQAAQWRPELAQFLAAVLAAAGRFYGPEQEDGSPEDSRVSSLAARISQV